MSVTSTSAITRLALNTWQTRSVLIGDDGAGMVVVDYKDSAGTKCGQVTLAVFPSSADKVVYTPAGDVSVLRSGVASAGIGAAILTAMSSGSLASRFQAVDDLLQARAVLPS